MHDRVSGETTILSIANDGTRVNSGSPSISSDGRYVAFTSRAANLITGDTNERVDVFVHDRVTGETTLVSTASDGTQGNGDSNSPSISEDGRYVAFESEASNLVIGDTNENRDVFIHDRVTGETILAFISIDSTVGNNLSGYPSISANGKYVAFQSWASNLVTDDTDENWDIFVHNVDTRETQRVSVLSDRDQGNLGSVSPSISADGRFIAFTSRF